MDVDRPAGAPSRLYLSAGRGGPRFAHRVKAAGKAGVDVMVDDRDFGKISGVAPGAAIAVYKAFWTGKSANDSGALTSDIVAAVDQAVADGVDVLNYSAGSTSETGPDSPFQAAFRTAAAAGIFISTAAGDSGPDPSSLDNVAPGRRRWLPAPSCRTRLRCGSVTAAALSAPVPPSR